MAFIKLDFSVTQFELVVGFPISVFFFKEVTFFFEANGEN